MQAALPARCGLPSFRAFHKDPLHSGLRTPYEELQEGALANLDTPDLSPPGITRLMRHAELAPSPRGDHSLFTP